MFKVFLPTAVFTGCELLLNSIWKFKPWLMFELFLYTAIFRKLKLLLKLLCTRTVSLLTGLWKYRVLLKLTTTGRMVGLL